MLDRDILCYGPLGFLLQFQLVQVSAHHAPIIGRICGNAEMEFGGALEDAGFLFQVQDGCAKVRMCWETSGGEIDKRLEGGCVLGQVINLWVVVALLPITRTIPMEPRFFENGKRLPFLTKAGRFEMQGLGSRLTFWCHLRNLRCTQHANTLEPKWVQKDCWSWIGGLGGGELPLHSLGIDWLANP